MGEFKKIKVVIAGAGPAGIVAAYELQKTEELRNKYDVTVVEETDDIGGISKTKEINGNRMDMGGHRFFSKDSKVIEWWNTILPTQGELPIDDIELSRNVEIHEGGPNPKYSDNVMLVRNRVSRIYFNNKFFDYPVKINLNTITGIGLFNTIKCGFGYLKSIIHKLPEDNLENFYINRFGKPLYRLFFEGYTEKLWGRHPSEISADWGAQRVKGLDLREILKDTFSKLLHIKRKNTETSLIERFYYPKFGPGQLWERALEIAIDNGVKFKNNTKLVGIELENQENYKSIKSVDIKTKVGNGYDYDILSCDWLISSVPLKDLLDFLPFKAQPNEIVNIAANLPYRDFRTCGILVDKLAVQNNTNVNTYNGLIPDCWIYIQDKKVRMGRLQIFNNWSPYMVKDFRNKVWIATEYFCDEKDNLWKMENNAFADLAIRELKDIGLIDNNSKVEMTHSERVKKAYPAYFDTYTQIDKLRKYLNNIDGLICVGRNGQHRYNNMDHSMLTAFKAVEILEETDKNKQSALKIEIWNINEEKVYHEKKERK